MTTHPFRADDVDVSPAELRERLDGAADLQLVDVREPYEWEAGRIEGATHIELERLASKAATLDRDRPVVFYCRLGARSGMAAQGFRRAGFEAYSLVGGASAWVAEEHPFTGEVADH